MAKSQVSANAITEKNAALEALAAGVRASAEVQTDTDASSLVTVQQHKLAMPTEQRRNKTITERKVVVVYSKALRIVYLSCWVDLALKAEAQALKQVKADLTLRSGLLYDLSQASDIAISQGNPWRASLEIAQMERKELAQAYESKGWRVCGNSSQKEKLVVKVEEYKAGTVTPLDLA